ncbi:MAG: 16S rRNA (guanine(527)-N(7))-methyltransferase RsmG [Flavobacteriales bacterium]|nr:16S rRNA (guanine(527)-N(7))-methyltransferase RsmG [Flavobacteriales bacterium]|tara:strand:- start:578 stop:1195 length:618 start_codon:yes stop_codon:yes gene_type:complete
MVQEVFKYFPNLTEIQREKFTSLYDIYAFWNNKINVISRNDFKNFYVRHVLHSMSIAKFKHFSNDTNIIDVGTGGGFPGIPLAILFPQVNFTLIDSKKKKIFVVNDVIKSLNLKNITTKSIRLELVKKKYDYLICRSVADTKTLLRWANDKIKKSKNKKCGLILLKGGDLKKELEGLNTAEIYEISSDYSEEFFKTKKIIFIPIS